jgi:CRISPR-associated endonuclease/helicase Cas3
MTFDQFFHQATKFEAKPYPYQGRLAGQPWPGILNIPTGMGKTASIILSWLYKRLHDDPKTPRRLVYCLPMRVLVEQTATVAEKWIKNLVDGGAIPLSRRPSIGVLMGGMLADDWDIYPDEDAILIGTQDQLLSRALNRGYSMSRFRWPVHFGLLNNDCLWVMDEVQLMGNGLATSAQLQAFRNEMGTIRPVHSVWMSATLQRNWLETIDFAPVAQSLLEFNLNSDDLMEPSLKRRFEASKPLERVDCPAGDYKMLAKLIMEKHKQGTRTLAVVNTIRRAMDLYNAVKAEKPEALLALVHSRFRPKDRLKALQSLLANPDEKGTICISTQVVEAGVDVSATTLFTDLAPWPSLVQRFGRCNRDGRVSNPNVICIELDLGKKGTALPYDEKELENAFSLLQGLTDVGPKCLPPFQAAADYKHVLRRKDVIELFDTTPDLAGADIDVSRFIREADDHDVQVFWRDIPDEGPSEVEPGPSRDELCSVSVNDLRAVKNLRKWRWDYLERKWVVPDAIYPGLTLMLRNVDGCYSAEMGWTGDRKNMPELLDMARTMEEANDDDYYSQAKWQTLADHNDAVVRELEKFLRRCPISHGAWADSIRLAARWHDAGKAHPVFQKAMLGDPPEADPSITWGKTGRKGITYERVGFRHELASALAMLQNGWPDLAAYLVAAHHGKVRLSIRSLPHEKVPGNASLRFARGIWEGDTLPQTHLGNGYTLSPTVLDLSYMEFGEGVKGPSWLARMLALLDDSKLGPFRLAYLESLLRIADWRASSKEGIADE